MAAYHHCDNNHHPRPTGAGRDLNCVHQATGLRAKVHLADVYELKIHSRAANGTGNYRSVYKTWLRPDPPPITDLTPI